MPQLRETGLNALPHLAQQLLVQRCILTRDEQKLSLFDRQGRRLTTIAQVAQQNAAVRTFRERQQ